MFIPTHTKVYLALGSTDMRKAMNGLSILVEERLELDPFSGHFFVFCNRRRDRVKILYWDRNGFCLWQKRLEKDRFIWPEVSDDVMEIDHRSLNWLLEGLDLYRVKAHQQLRYATLL
jgi:transposase